MVFIHLLFIIIINVFFYLIHFGPFVKLNSGDKTMATPKKWLNFPLFYCLSKNKKSFGSSSQHPNSSNRFSFFLTFFVLKISNFILNFMFLHCFLLDTCFNCLESCVFVALIEILDYIDNMGKWQMLTRPNLKKFHWLHVPRLHVTLLRSMPWLHLAPRP